jgi:hypothetical protein
MLLTSLLDCCVARDALPVAATDEAAPTEIDTPQQYGLNEDKRDSHGASLSPSKCSIEDRRGDAHPRHWYSDGQACHQPSEVCPSGITVIHVSTVIRVKAHFAGREGGKRAGHRKCDCVRPTDLRFSGFVPRAEREG